jgi:hypothetical protein
MLPHLRANEAALRFLKMKGMRDGYRNECKVCNLQQKHERYVADPEPAKERVRAWQLANPKRYQENQRRWKESGGKSRSDRKSHLKRKFGLTPNEYAAKLEWQRGVCMICQQPPADGQFLDVDHDHGTGRPRGLLCRNCNQRQGQFREDPFLLAAAAGYLIMWDAEDPEEFPRVRLAIGGEPRRLAS